MSDWEKIKSMMGGMLLIIFLIYIMGWLAEI
jgi:hypothetical protein